VKDPEMYNSIIINGIQIAANTKVSPSTTGAIQSLDEITSFKNHPGNSLLCNTDASCISLNRCHRWSGIEICCNSRKVSQRGAWLASPVENILYRCLLLYFALTRFLWLLVDIGIWLWIWNC